MLFGKPDKAVPIGVDAVGQGEVDSINEIAISSFAGKSFSTQVREESLPPGWGPGLGDKAAECIG